MKLRVPVSVVVMLAVLWTAMAPLTGALREGGDMPLCHQAGMQVDAASSPMPQQPGEAPTRKTHCPLCIMVFFAAFGAKPIVPPFQVTLAAPMAPQRSTPAVHRFIVGLPPGRAPPVSLLA